MGADLPYWRGDYLDFAVRYRDRYPVWLGQAQPPRLIGSALAGGDAEFAEDRGYVMFDGSHRNEQAGGDLLVGMALRQKFKNFLLASRQTVRMCPSRGARTGGN